MTGTLRLNLLENSHSFLAESLKKALSAENDLHDWKFAIFNVCQAIEISMKERLRQEHFSLVFSNIDKRTRTVNSREAIKRLREICNVPLLESDSTVICRSADWRNEIVHAEFSLKVSELKSAFSALLGFLATFHQTVLGESLDKVIPQELWQEAIAIQDYGRELFSRAKQRFQEEGIDDDTIIPCPKCGWKSCALFEDDCRCYVCGASENLVECEDCGELAPESQCELVGAGFEDDYHQVHICRTCIDGAEDRWINQLIDMERGK